MWQFSTKVLINWKHFICPRHFLFFVVHFLQKLEIMHLWMMSCVIYSMCKKLMPPKWQGNIKMQDQGPCVQVILILQLDATWLMCPGVFKSIIVTYFLANVLICDRNVSFQWVYCNNDSTGLSNDWFDNIMNHYMLMKKTLKYILLIARQAWN